MYNAVASEQSPKYAIAKTALPEPVVKIETFLKICKAESNRTTQKLDSRHLLFLYLPGHAEMWLLPPLQRRLPADGSVMAWHFFFFLPRVQQKAWNDSTHLLIRQRPGMTQHILTSGKGLQCSRWLPAQEPVMARHFLPAPCLKSMGRGLLAGFLKLFLYVFLRGPGLVVFQPSVGFVSKDKMEIYLK